MLSTTKFRAASLAEALRGATRSALTLACLLFCILTAIPSFAQEQIAVEAIRHENFGRMIITFEGRMDLPDYEVTSDNGVLVVQFDTELDGILPDVGTTLLDYVAVARFDPGKQGIRMGLKGPVQVNTIEAGEQLFVDLLPPDWVGLPPGLPPETVERLARRAEEAARIAEERRRAEMVAEYNPQAKVRVGKHPTFARVHIDWNVGTKATFTQEGQQAEIAFDWPVPVDLYEILSALSSEIVSAENTVNRGNTVIALQAAEGVDLRFYEDSSASFILDVDLPGAPSGGVDIAVLAEQLGEDVVAELEQTPDIEAGEPLATDEDKDITPFVTSGGGVVRVVFPFSRDTPAAVFRRANVVWMLFDTQATIANIDTSGAPAYSSLVEDFSVQRSGSAQVVRMALDEDRLATLGSEGRSWVLSLGDVLLEATEPVALERRKTGSGLYQVTADLGRPSQVHQFHDPEVGDTLEVVTAYPPARGMIRSLDYVDFSAPKSVHGLVIKPHRDDVRVAIEDRLAVISSDTGLTVSSAQDLRFRAPDESRVSAMDLSAYLVPSPDVFDERLEEIIQRTAEAEGRELDRARLDLAKFYLGNDFAHEALGVLSVLRRELRHESLEPSVTIASAAARTIAGRPEEALPLLNSELFRDEADTMVWRTIANAELENYAAARLDAMGGHTVIDVYPNWVRTRFQLAAIRASIEDGDESMAARLLKEVELSRLNRDQLSEYELLSGMLDELNGRNAEALESYGRVIAADRRPTTSEAVLRTINLLDALDRLDVARAADTLAVQATIWRGDSIELDIVRKLVDLRYRNGEYRTAFRLTRQAAALYKESEMLGSLVARARQEFEGLYLDGGADALEPVEALSIYYDYRHLTPPGSEGDTMIRNLARRLIKVDLLAQAAELLEYQVDHRLEGAARAQVAADLAVVQIANRQPTKALEALHRTRLAGLPPGLERQRRVLEASALIHANRQELALDLLSSLKGRDTELLRIEALWKDKKYREAAEQIETFYAPDLSQDNLSPIARMNIVKAAVGYVLDGDRLGLARLRSRYSDVMSRAPEWPMFAFVTDNVEATSEGFREIARQIADIDSINAFLNAYRQIYAGQDAVTPLHVAPETADVASL